MKLDLDRVRENVRKTSTEDLLDRVTVYRAEMESAALEIINAELEARGVSSAQVDAHAAMREQDALLRHPDGTVVRMSCYTAEYSGALAASSEIDELAWFGYADRPRVPPVDRLLFDDLCAAGRLR